MPFCFTRLLPAILGSCLLIQLTAADGDPSLPNGDLIAEHRQAKEASILDSIASLFGGGTEANPKKPQSAIPRPGPIYRPPLNPVIRRQQQKQQQAASQQRPLVIQPPKTFKKPFYPPAPVRLATSETNRNSVVQPGRIIFLILIIFHIKYKNKGGCFVQLIHQV